MRGVIDETLRVCYATADCLCHTPDMLSTGYAPILDAHELGLSVSLEMNGGRMACV